MDLYHIINRGVDGRLIFKDDEDRYRFIHDLFEFNDSKNVNNNCNFFRKIKPNSNDIGYHYDWLRSERQKRNFIVNLHAFCLMPNHYHLVVSPLVDNGISLFMRKLNGGYSRYFNGRHKRDGALFKGKYKAVRVISNEHFIHLPYYVHLNPLDLKYPEWRERAIVDLNMVLDFLNHYKWSSHLDYMGIKNFPSLTQREYFNEFFGGVKKYGEAIKEWLSSLKSLTISDIVKNWE